MTTQQIGNCHVHPYIKAQTFQLCAPCVDWLRYSFHDDQYKAAAWDFAAPGRMFHIWVQWFDGSPAYPLSSTYGYSTALGFLEGIKGEVSWASIQHLGRTVALVQDGEITVYREGMKNELP